MVNEVKLNSPIRSAFAVLVVDTRCAGRCVTHGVLGGVVDMRCAGRCCVTRGVLGVVV